MEDHGTIRYSQPMGFRLLPIVIFALSLAVFELLPSLILVSPRSSASVRPLRDENDRSGTMCVER